MKKARAKKKDVLSSLLDKGHKSIIVKESEVISKFFKEANVHSAEKCCANCATGSDTWDSESIRCDNPKLNYTFRGEKHRACLSLHAHCVCDRWKPRKES